jgi:CRP/FNR family cyclic AMP-dependent transcriptional regulator
MALRRGRFKGRECRYLYRLSSQSRAYCYQMPSAAHSIAALVGNRRKAHTLKKNHAVYSQGDPADSVFLLQDGRVRLSVLSTRGKEAIIAVLESGSFFGEECLAGQPFRMARATAMTVGTVLEIKKKTMVSVVRGKREFAAAFMAHLLSRNIRIQEDLVDQLFNSSEKRLARILLLLANFGKEGRPETVIPTISQETLAEMIGTTRSRVSGFMNKFRKLGFIEYNSHLNGHLNVHSSLLNVILHD